MNKTIIGLICVILGTILDAILPIVFQESDLEIFSYLFIMSFVFIILALIHIKIFNKNLNEVISIIKEKSTDLKILLYGSIRYIKYLLFTFGALSVQTGIYNALIASQIIFLTYSASKDENIKIITPEKTSFFILFIGICVIIYNSLNNEKGKINKNFIYGVIALIVALMLDIKDDTGFKKITDNPYEDILLSSIVMFIISVFVILFRKNYMKKDFGIKNINNLLYLIAIPILIIEYIPSILEFTTHDYLPTIVIMAFFGVQSLIGFGLDKYYYKDIFTSTKYIGIIILLIGIIYSIYSYYLQHKDTINIAEYKTKIQGFFYK
jgi:drug/metabolite transporter (DMT)-like permease